MDSNASSLENALSVLRQQYGERLPGPQESGLAQMRETLRQQLSLDEITADRLVDGPAYTAGSFTLPSMTLTESSEPVDRPRNQLCLEP